MLIELHETDGFFAAIVEMPTGIKYTNQTCGTACAHPQMEGILVPLDASLLPQDARNDPMYDEYSHEVMRKEVSRFLTVTHQLPYFEPLHDVDVHGGQNFTNGEAWVQVRVRGDAPEPFVHLRGKRAVLTYPNSD